MFGHYNLLLVNTRQFMLRQVLFIFIGLVGSIFFISAQDYPYPVSPDNTNVVATAVPTLVWKPSANFNAYILEIYSCSYNEGSSFDVLELENFIYQEVINGPYGYETSALTYSLRRPGNYTTIDDGGGLGITDYTNGFGNNTTHTATSLAGNDYEGLTYLYNDYYALVEERLDYLIFLKFNYNNQGEVSSVDKINTISMNNTFITGSNNGWEGLTYNPRNDKLYLAKEISPIMFFETNLPSGVNFTGSVNLTQPFNINNTSWVPNDVSGLFHVSLDIKASATPAGDHILILSEEDEKMFEVDLNGNLISEKEFNSSGLFGSITNGNFKPEGITYQNGDIWIASDTDPGAPARYYRFSDPYYEAPTTNNSGLIYTKANLTTSQYQVPNGIILNNTEYCWRVIGVNANGQQIPSEYYSFTTNIPNMGGCLDNTACNYNASANTDDGSCLYLDCKGICGGADIVGAACNDNDSATVNDVYINNCNCKGTIINGCTDAGACNYAPNATVNNGSCLYVDCVGVCGGTNILGALCNDNNPSTINDKYALNCNCIGTPLPGCINAAACNYNPLAGVNDGSCKFVTDCLNQCGGPVGFGFPCNDGNPLTTNDTYDLFCNCNGINNNNNNIISVCFNIVNGNDDAEESNGVINFASNDLDLADLTSKITGLRFNNIDIPFGSNILNSYFQFTAGSINNQQTNLTISVENSNNASIILNTTSNISSRNYINSVVQWNNVLSWQFGERSGRQKSPSIAQLVQQVVNKNGWQANNSMLFKIVGTGQRAAAAFESGYDGPQLCIEYLPLQCPQSISLTNSVTNDQTISVEIQMDSSSSITNSTVNYFAGDTIVLLSGFQIDSNSNFSAFIQDCQ